VVVPSLNKVVGATVERQLSRTINDTVAKVGLRHASVTWRLFLGVLGSIKILTLRFVLGRPSSTIGINISENVEHVMSGPAFVNNLTTVRSPIEDSFKDSFTKALIPSYQKAS